MSKITFKPNPSLPKIPEEKMHFGIYLARELKRRGGTITFPEFEEKTKKLSSKRRTKKK